MVQIGIKSLQIWQKRWEKAQFASRNALLLLVAALSLAFGTPTPLHASSQKESSAEEAMVTPTPHSETNDGFQLTITAFQLFEKKGNELTVVLRKLQAEAAGSPDDPAKQKADFLAKLTHLYPGSTFDGTTGTIPFQKEYVAHFNSALKVTGIKENGATITTTYDFEQETIELVGQSSSVTAVIDRSKPSRSRFSHAVIPAMALDAEKNLTIPGFKRTATRSVETSVLNDAYQLLSQTNALRMDDFAADIIRYPALRLKALNIVTNGYHERHPDEYQRGVESARPALILRSAVTASPSKSVGTLILVAALVATAFLAARGTNQTVKSLFMSKAERAHAKRFNTLSPMVVRILTLVGTSLWGKNLLMSKKFSIIKRSDRWLLCEGKIDDKNPPSTAKSRLEVCMRSNCFRLKITRLNGVAVKQEVMCNNFSAGELTEKVSEISALFGRETSDHEQAKP